MAIFNCYVTVHQAGYISMTQPMWSRPMHQISPGIHDKAGESTFHGEGKKLRESWPFLMRLPQALLGILYTYWCMYIYICFYI